MSFIKVNGLMSAILLSQKNDSYLDEQQIERYDDEMESSILKKSVLYEEKEEREDWYLYDPFDIEE